VLAVERDLRHPVPLRHLGGHRQCDGLDHDVARRPVPDGVGQDAAGLAPEVAGAVAQGGAPAGRVGRIAVEALGRLPDQADREGLAARDGLGERGAQDPHRVAEAPAGWCGGGDGRGDATLQGQPPDLGLDGAVGSGEALHEVGGGERLL